MFIFLIAWHMLGFPVAQMVKNLHAMQETWVWSLVQEDRLEKGIATHTYILALRIPLDRGAWWAIVHGVAESDTTEWLTYAHTAIRVTLLQAKWYYHLNFQMRNLKLSEAKWLCTKPDSKSRAAPEWKPRSPDPLFCSQHQFVSSSSLRKPVPSLE